MGSTTVIEGAGCVLKASAENSGRVWRPRCLTLLSTPRDTSIANRPGKYLSQVSDSLLCSGAHASRPVRRRLSPIRGARLREAGDLGTSNFSSRLLQPPSVSRRFLFTNSSRPDFLRSVSRFGQFLQLGLTFGIDDERRDVSCGLCWFGVHQPRWRKLVAGGRG